MSYYVTVQFDRLDRICKRKYGTERNGNVEMVLAVNPGLAEMLPIIPQGVSIFMPEMKPAVKVNKPITLWS